MTIVEYNCKECSNKGKPVKKKTLESLVKESKLATIKGLEGFYFCETPECKVVYFNNEQNIYLFKEDVKVRVGIKETEEPIPVCYCFGWTREKIFNQIKELGRSTAVEEISAKVKDGECACEVNNPAGRCCLSEVKKTVEMGFSTIGKSATQKEGKSINLPIVGSIISAILASTCCIGPVVLAILGVSSAGLFSKLSSFRPYFIGLAVILLGAAFYLTLRRKEIICEDGTCKHKTVSKGNLFFLLIATLLVIFFLAFPYLNLSNQNPNVPQTMGEIKGELIEVTIPVEGLTCSTCEPHIEKALKKMDGIIQVKPNSQNGHVFVKFDNGKLNIDKIVEELNKTGYKATKR